MPMMDSTAAGLLASLRADLGMREPTSREREAFEAKLIGNDEPAFPKPCTMLVPEIGAAEFHRKYIVNRVGIVARDADLPAVGSFHG